MSDLVISLHRIEPVSRRGDPGRGLAATVHDPLWTLARQLQFGELTGEDTGSPVQVELRLQHHPLTGWRPDATAQSTPYAPDAQVLEAVVAGESAGPELSLRDRIDAGRRLRAVVGQALNERLRATFPLPTAANPGLAPRAAAVFADGLAAAAALRGVQGESDAAVAAALGATEAQVATARDELTTFAAWCETTFGLGSASWIPERLERRFELEAAGVNVLRAPAHTRGVVDALDLDLTAGAANLPADPEAAGDPATRRIPSTIRFPGMPNDRFWQFEDAQLALYRIDAATHDLARLALVEFSSVYGNDWFTFPVPVEYGSVSWISELVVQDTFGRREVIAAASDPNWSMFVPTRPTGVGPASSFRP